MKFWEGRLEDWKGMEGGKEGWENKVKRKNVDLRKIKNIFSRF